MMSSRSILALTIALAWPCASACSGSSEGVEVPGATTTAASIPAVSTSSTAPTTLVASSSSASASTTAPTTTAAATTEPPPLTTAERTVTLVRQGDEGPRVEVVQRKLIVLGYLPAGSATGVFDGATNGAVLEFQSDYGLVVDGLVGPQTERAISAAAESINPEG